MCIIGLHCFGAQNVIGVTNDVMSDTDTEEALAEFDFLVSSTHEGSGETRPINWGKLKIRQYFEAEINICGYYPSENVFFFAMP